MRTTARKLRRTVTSETRSRSAHLLGTTGSYILSVANVACQERMWRVHDRTDFARKSWTDQAIARLVLHLPSIELPQLLRIRTRQVDAEN
jgi:hypothetical protein